MSLDVTLRGILERDIDSIIEGIPQLIEVHRKDKIPEMKITTEQDYILGLAHGTIMGSFISTYRAINKDNPSLQVLQESGSVMYRRTRDILAAIDKAG